MNIVPYVFLKFVGATPDISHQNVCAWLQQVVVAVHGQPFMTRHTPVDPNGHRSTVGINLQELKLDEVSI